MATGVFCWSRTAASNSTADSAINWSEGQSPSSVNDSARAMMAKVAEFRDDNSGALTTGGISTAYTVTAYEVFDTLANMSGKRLALKFHTANGASPTLNVQGLGAKAIQTLSGTAVPTGAIKTNSVWELVYDNSIPAWVLVGAPTAEFLTSGTIAPSSVLFSATQRILGRYSASGGAGEELSLGTGILLSGAGVLSAASSQGVEIINGTIVSAEAANAVTFSLKTLAGTDPSATDPVYIVFRNVTPGTGNYVVRTITAANSLTISSGSNMGVSTNSQPFRLWLVFFDDAGTVRMGAVNCLTGTGTPDAYPLGQFPIASSTAEGGAGGADSAHVIYTGTAVASKAYVVAAYASYETGQAAAGSWTAAPTRIQLYGPGVPLPGALIQQLRTGSTGFSSGTTVMPNDDTIPQSGEGDEYMTQAITPGSACNALRAIALAHMSNASTSNTQCALFRDAGADAVAADARYTAGSAGLHPVLLDYVALAGAASATTFKFRAGPSGAGTVQFNGSIGARLMGGVMNSFMEVQEIMG
jgi:hypothetical protein